MPGTRTAIDVLRITSLKGSPSTCGKAYGSVFEERITGFCCQEVKPDKKRLAYARRCWRHICRSAPVSAEFMTGVASGAHISIDHVTLLSLHEEVGRLKHCTAFTATGAAARGGKTIAAMNWDWAANSYVWPGLLQLSMKGCPATLTYHYPGLWSCAGINEHGLAIVWTSAGYMPKITPVVGVPTYVLIAEVLQRRNVEEAVACLRSAKNAGSFIFFLADAGGKTALVETVPGRHEVERSSDIMCRANHFETPSIVSLSRQDLSSSPESTTRYRAKRARTLLRRHSGSISAATARSILTDRSGRWPWIHQFLGGPSAMKLSESVTIDSLVAVCRDRVLWTCRGGRKPGPWRRIPVLKTSR